MRVVFYVLNKVDKLDEILSEFVNRGIRGATVLESAGMASLLNEKHDEGDMPFLGSLRFFLNPEKEKSNVLFTVIRDEQLPAVVEAIESAVGDLSEKNKGILFSFPVDFIKGISNADPA